MIFRNNSNMFDTGDLVAVCDNCGQKLHTKEGQLDKALKRMMFEGWQAIAYEDKETQEQEVSHLCNICLS